MADKKRKSRMTKKDKSTKVGDSNTGGIEVKGTKAGGAKAEVAKPEC